MGVTPSENFWTLWRPSQGVTPVTFCSKNILFRNFWGVMGITTCDGRHTPSDGRHTPSDGRHTLITKINQSNEKYYCMTGVTPFEVFQWSMNGWIEWTWDWILSELFRLQVIIFYSFENNTTSTATFMSINVTLTRSSQVLNGNWTPQVTFNKGLKFLNGEAMSDFNQLTSKLITSDDWII